MYVFCYSRISLCTCIDIVIKKKRKVVARLDQVMSNYARHKRLEEQQQVKLGEPLHQRLFEPVQPAFTNTKVRYMRTNLCMYIYVYIRRMYIYRIA